jgi:putative oxidoreductase
MTSHPAAAYGITLLRLSLGLMWVAHALLKPLVFTMAGTAQFLDGVGLPGALVWPLFLVELTGGLALLLGVYARQVSLLLAPVMAVAAWVHVPNGWVHTSTGGGWEYPVFLTVASLVLWLLGDGAFALRRARWLAPATAGVPA